MASWATGPDDLRHLYEDQRLGHGSLSTYSACGLPELGRKGKDDGKGRCSDCVGLAALMDGAGES